MTQSDLIHGEADSVRFPYSAMAEAWPLLRPHVREAIVTLIDAELIRARLSDSSIEMNENECGLSDGSFSEP